MTQTVDLCSDERMQAICLSLSNTLQEIFSTMFGVDSAVVPSGEISEPMRISSIIGFGGQLSGFLSLHFSERMACNITSGLLGASVDQIDETVRDAVGELVNMIAGGLKARIGKGEESLKLSIPSVIEGREYSTRGPVGCKELVVGVVAGDARFKLQLALEVN